MAMLPLVLAAVGPMPAAAAAAPKKSFRCTAGSLFLSMMAPQLKRRRATFEHGLPYCCDLPHGFHSWTDEAGSCEN